MQIPKNLKKIGIRAFVVIVATIITAGTQAFNKSNNSDTLPVEHKTDKSESTPMNDNRRKIGHKTIHLDSYNDALWVLWNKVYPGKNTSLYCEQEFDTQSGIKVGKQGINAEHVFPMGWVTNALKCGTRKECRRNSKQFRVIEADLHNIYPANIKANRERMSFPFGEIEGEKRQFGQGCDFEVDRQRRIAEPRNAARGDIARAMLYMSYQYDLPIFEKTQKLLKQWDKQDAPSKEEKRRESVIQETQGRENPFITRYPFSG